MNYTKGIDISYHQDIAETPQHINFDLAKLEGAEFVFIRSSIGTSQDRDFETNRANAKQSGLLRGYYHFLTWKISGKEQAEYFYNLVKDDPAEVGLCVDFEPGYKIETPKTAIFLLRDFLVELRKLYTGKIIIYTNAFFWKDYGSLDPFYASFPLWLASYTSQDYAEEKMLEFTPWKSWTLWQHTDRLNGLAYGMESKQVDGDYFNGSLDDLRKFCGLVEEPKTDLDALLKEIEFKQNEFECDLAEVNKDMKDLTSLTSKLIDLAKEIK